MQLSLHNTTDPVFAQLCANPKSEISLLHTYSSTGYMSKISLCNAIIRVIFLDFIKLSLGPQKTSRTYFAG